jgi:ATP-binding cassette subfamily C (CFTR/MRP) protein 1
LGLWVVPGPAKPHSRWHCFASPSRSNNVGFCSQIRLSSGTITIDGIDISKLGLNTLRSKIAIIPQEPVLFSGTLRSNLDPFDLYDDNALHDAMKRSCLTGVSNGSKIALDTEVKDEGSNLSA